MRPPRDRGMILERLLQLFGAVHAIVGRDQVEQQPSDHFIRSIAEELFDLAVRGEDDAVLVDFPDPIAGHFKQFTISIFGGIARSQHFGHARVSMPPCGGRRPVMKQLRTLREQCIESRSYRPMGIAHGDVKSKARRFVIATASKDARFCRPSIVNSHRDESTEPSHPATAEEASSARTLSTSG